MTFYTSWKILLRHISCGRKTKVVGACSLELCSIQPQNAGMCICVKWLELCSSTQCVNECMYVCLYMYVCACVKLLEVDEACFIYPVYVCVCVCICACAHMHICVCVCVWDFFPLSILFSPASKESLIDQKEFLPRPQGAFDGPSHSLTLCPTSVYPGCWRWSLIESFDPRSASQGKEAG